MKARRIIKKAAVFALCLLMFVSAAVGILGLTLRHTFENGAELSLRITDGEYCRKMYGSLYNTLEKRMALVVIKTDDISPYLTEAIVADKAKLASAMVINELFGEDSDDWRFESDEILEHIASTLKAYAEETGIEYEDGSAEQVYEMICDTVTAELRVIPESYVSKISPVIQKAESVLALWYIPVIVWIALSAVLMVMERHHILRGLYSLFMTAYFSMFTLWAASAILYSKDYLAKTVLGDTMLQALIRGLYNTVLYDVRQITLVLMSALLLMSVSVIIALALKVRRYHRRREKGMADSNDGDETAKV